MKTTRGKRGVLCYFVLSATDAWCVYTSHVSRAVLRYFTFYTLQYFTPLVLFQYKCNTGRVGLTKELPPFLLTVKGHGPSLESICVTNKCGVWDPGD